MQIVPGSFFKTNLIVKQTQLKDFKNKICYWKIRVLCTPPFDLASLQGGPKYCMSFGDGRGLCKHLQYNGCRGKRSVK